jgi:hypothetical protein
MDWARRLFAFSKKFTAKAFVFLLSHFLSKEWCKKYLMHLLG